MGMGYLKVELRTGTGALPVSGIHILIKDPKGNIIHETVTDESGNTSKIRMEAPDAPRLYNPNDMAHHYSVYDVEVKPEKGYMGEIIHGVHIFDKETTILPVNMMPGTEKRPQEPEYEEIYIPRSFGVEMDRGYMLPDEEQLTAQQLSSVIIPDYITVHLGSPNATANNVRVPFIDYVKNVASHEIFPTWPAATLEANIYAQISFVLNRVFTVWYRSIGKDFDITNNTAFDQYFVYGGEIFESVSRIADRIFNSFIRRRGRLEPFMAQYCNGTTSICDGLSQWGSYYLGLQGYTYLQILKQYYPQDIEIVTSTNFATPGGTYPGSPLKEGASGPDVQTMQNYLNRIRTDWPAIPQIANPNGVFLSSTVNAVKAFQNIFDLAADGIIGSSTWYRIVRTFVGVKKLAEMSSEGIRIGIGLSPPTSVLTINSRGADVVELQFLLNFIAEFYPTIPTVIQDGKFGDDTKRSVMAFQSRFGLTPDGVVGPATWNKLYEVYKYIYDTTNVHPETPTPPTVNPPFPGTLLKVGSTGSNVLLMQQYLNVISTVFTSIPRLSEDSIFGSQMEAAVKTFQTLFGLTADGIIGQMTWNRIVTERNNISGTPSGPAFPGTTLRIGSTGSSVTLMQEYLNAIGRVYTSIPQVVADGVFGSRTHNAVLAFQRQFGLTQDGLIGRITWDRIVSEYNRLGLTPTIPDFPGTALRIGSTGYDVSLMQGYLNTIANVQPTIPKQSVDGIFGTQMRNAVMEFQRLYGLDIDGIIGRNTWNSIATEYNRVSASQMMARMLVMSRMIMGMGF